MTSADPSLVTARYAVESIDDGVTLELVGPVRLAGVRIDGGHCPVGREEEFAVGRPRQIAGDLHAPAFRSVVGERNEQAVVGPGVDEQSRPIGAQGEV